MASIIESRAAKFFREGHYEDAAQAYTDELALLSQGAANENKLQLLCNRTSCYLKMKQYGLVVEDCTLILELDTNNQKAFSRKVSALRKLGYYNEAHKTACKWSKLNPTSTQAEQQAERLRTLVDALDDPEEDVDTELINEEFAGERIPPEGREDDVSVRSPNNVSNQNNSSNSTPDGKSNSFYCEFCGITFQTKRELALHCRSDLHRKKIVSDEGRDWKYRPPPRGQTGEEYTICQRFADDGKCRLGDRCVKAHSAEELAEWKERFEYKKNKVQKAKEIMLAGNSYSDQLMEKLMKAERPELVMVQKLENINFSCNTSLKSTTTNKRFSESWMFTIASRETLQRICLLDDQHRHLFSFNTITVGPKKLQRLQKIEDNCQEWTNQDTVDNGPNSLQKVYRIKVAFRTEIYGTFRQTIIFDFGSEPVLMKEICVDSTPVTSLEELTKQITCILDVPRWDTTKIPLIEFCRKSSSSQTIQTLAKDKELIAKYPVPQAGSFTPSQAVLNLTLSKDNYKARMHDLLYIEEMAQYSSIARYNVKTQLQLVQRFLLIPGQTDKVKEADEGELIARMNLNSDLCEDTLHGRLILQNVFTVYLAPHSDKSKHNPVKIYEAFVEDRGKDFLMIRLCPQMVTALKLEVDTSIWMQVQFHLNRVPACQMHLALDKLEDPELLFPEKTQRPAIPWTPKRQWSEQKDSKLNAKQREAVVAITTSGSIHLPPILIVGPYGTGKTYTLAQAAKQLLQTDSSRILICTHSNSAADLYVRDYFHPCVLDGNDDARPLRIYYRHRRVDTVDRVVIQYCLIDSVSASEVYFRMPSKADIEKHRIIVVTLSTSQDLYNLGLPKGYFTHILLDEAAQAMECETIMPLALAGPQTRVVMAGDHMQMSPEVHSDFARDRNLHISLLERLYDLYPNDNPAKILLCENYRSHKAIIDYTSELFYDDKLITSGKQPRHEAFYPLTFFTARGEDEQHANSTAYFNNAEVYELVERVVELRKNWPESWGEFQDSSIGVVAPYHDQVSRIRAELRKKKLYNVSVERVFNVQGKQFRAIFISTVRTRKTCSSDPAEEDQMDYGFLSNAKLLNTAITRAQSLVAVVGDPVSLCSVGKCRKLWERFIEICSGNNSLFGITWNQLRSQLDGVEMKKTYTLNPLAPEFVPNRLRHPIPGETGYPSDGSHLPTNMMQGVPPWMVRFGQMFQPPVYRYPQVYQHMWQPQPHPIFMPNYFQPPHPNMLGWQHLVPQPGPTGSGPPSPARSKESIKAAQESAGGHNAKDCAAPKTPVKCAVHPPGHPHLQAMLSLQARGSPIYIQNPGNPHFRTIPGHGLAGWSHPFIGQPVRARYPQMSPPAAQLSPVPGFPLESREGAQHDGQPRISGKAASPSHQMPKPRAQIQLLPNVRHVPPHLLDQASNAGTTANGVHQRKEQKTEAMLSQSPHLQREFYSYIMQTKGVDAANNFIKSIQQEGQMGSSSTAGQLSPVPGVQVDGKILNKPSFPGSSSVNRKTLNSKARVAEVSCDNISLAEYGMEQRQTSPFLSTPANHRRTLSPAQQHHQNMLRSPPSPFSISMEQQRKAQQDVSHLERTFAGNGEAAHSNDGNASNVDFSVPTDMDRILKMMEESVNRNRQQSPFGVANSPHSGASNMSESDDAEASCQQRTAPPLYMRGSDLGGRHETSSPKPMSYAAVLRSKPQPIPMPPSSSDADKPEDPLDLLKNLNIKASPGTQALYQYFS